ncbi:MFS transporter [Xaviernesmea oryzae]|uniref:hypothetical protein n=1 Tax=Xaviernesmea oryzae TaxID=464029 RepID=UPI0008CF31DD|nr:hypothetical protein [Xaviernesmea oryzae]SEK68186.1 hypothetical protein SAMN04487976_103280 [Xaviernesmea oryzae]
MTLHLRVLLILAVTQTAGWGMINVLAVLAPEISATLRVSLPAVFAGTGVMYVCMGLAAPLAGRAFQRFGAKRAATAGACLIGIGLAAVAAASSWPLYLAAWR